MSLIEQAAKRLEQLRTSPPPAGIDNFFYVTFEGLAFMGATSLDAQNVASLAYLVTEAGQGIAQGLRGALHPFITEAVEIRDLVRF